MTSTITSKGQTTIPGPVRQALNVKPGDRITYEIEQDHVTIRAHPGLGSLMGSLPSKKGKGRRFKDVREAVVRAWAEGAAKEGLDT